MKLISVSLIVAVAGSEDALFVVDSLLLSTERRGRGGGREYVDEEGNMWMRKGICA